MPTVIQSQKNWNNVRADISIPKRKENMKIFISRMKENNSPLTLIYKEN